MLYKDMPILHKITGEPTLKKLKRYDSEKNIYYRLQDPKYELGTQSWGMIYSTPEEALEDGQTVLNGKSCWSTTKEMLGYTGTADPDAVVLVVVGDWVEIGHDDEDVVDVEEILEVWDQKRFREIGRKYLASIREQEMER